MKLFYFVGGPRLGHRDEYFRRLVGLGGPPPGWQIYPHTNRDGQALHLVTADSPQDILDHLRHFEGLYDHTEILEIHWNEES